MQINLKQTEIETALRDYVSKLGFSLEGREVEIIFTSGRKSNGLTADIEISDTVTTSAAPDPVPTLDTPIKREVETTPVYSELVEEDEPAFEVPSPATPSLFGG